jgi:hypothetical protein
VAKRVHPIIITKRLAARATSDWMMGKGLIKAPAELSLSRTFSEFGLSNKDFADLSRYVYMTVAKSPLTIPTLPVSRATLLQLRTYFDQPVGKFIAALPGKPVRLPPLPRPRPQTRSQSQNET